APGRPRQGARVGSGRPLVAGEPRSARRDRGRGRCVNDAKELAGQVALITGGGRGIGRGIALELESAGAEVAVAARTREQVEDVAAEVAGLAIEADGTDEDEVERMVEETERELGPIDLLVANAGIGNEPDPLWESDIDEWWQVFEVNVRGVYLTVRGVLPGMIDRGSG